MLIYKITNLLNGKVYVGQTTWPSNHRRSIHFSQLRRNAHNNKHLQSAFNKYGKHSFVFEVIQEISPRCPVVLNESERQWIRRLDSCNPSFGYNIEMGGSKNRSSFHSAWNKGLPRELQPRFGKKLDQALIQERRALREQKKAQFKTKNKVRSAPWNKGIKTGLTPWNKGLPKEKQSRFGAKHSAETIKRMSESQNKRVYSEDQKNFARTVGKKVSVPIKCISTGEVFCSQIEASRKLGIKRTRITEVLRGKKKHHKGLVFERVF